MKPLTNFSIHTVWKTFWYFVFIFLMVEIPVHQRSIEKLLKVDSESVIGFQFLSIHRELSITLMMQYYLEKWHVSRSFKTCGSTWSKVSESFRFFVSGAISAIQLYESIILLHFYLLFATKYIYHSSFFWGSFILITCQFVHAVSLIRSRLIVALKHVIDH